MIAEAERSYDAERKARKRSGARDLAIPAVADLDLRRACLADPFEFLSTCFPHVFYQGWTDDRREMVEAIVFAARHGGDQAIAGPRGEGKTRLTLFVALWLLLAGFRRFPMILGKSSPRAQSDLKALKGELETNEPMAALFPEVVVPIMALEGWASRARLQTVGGESTRIEWAADHIVFPTVADSAFEPKEEQSLARGQILAALGIEGPVRGYTIRNIRPDLAILDDIDDRESARSETQTETREAIIDQDVAGLGGPGTKIARVFLCTLLNHKCTAATYTDSSKRPSWRGKRFRALVEEPTRMDLWDQYIGFREGRDADDPLARTAHRFYLDNRDEMDAGAVVSNPQNFDGAEAYDGEPLEVSSLQHIFNLIADLGRTNFDTEYQNSPPADTDVEEGSGLTEQIVRGSHRDYAGRCNGLERAVVPDGSQRLSAFVDLGKRRLHWMIVSHGPRWVDVIDYGAKRTHQPDVVGDEEAIRVALDEMADSFETCDWWHLVEFFGVDAGNWNKVVYEFVQRRGAPWRATMGDAKYRHPPKSTREKRPGPQLARWYDSRQPAGLWVVNFDADHWKHELVRRLLVQPGTSEIPADKSIRLFGDDPREHVELSEHLTAEEYVRKFVEGKGWKEGWQKLRRSNHWLDCGVGCLVGGSVATRRARPSVRVSELTR